VSGTGKVAKLQGIQWLDSSIDSKITSNLNFGGLNLKPHKEGSLSEKHNLQEEKGWWMPVKASNWCHRTSYLETTVRL
jgi:hypothetical protein